MLLFKHKLSILSPEGSDEVLIKQKVLPKQNSLGEIVWEGKGKKTVDVTQIRERFDSLSVKTRWDRLKKITDFRNDIEHYHSNLSIDAIKPQSMKVISMLIVNRPIFSSIFVFCFLAFITNHPALGKETVEISNQESAQFQISSLSSPKVYVDVIDTSYIQAPIARDDILVVTHSHPDHYDREFCGSFPGKTLIFKEGVLEFNNGKVITIPSAHTDKLEDKFISEGGSNYIAVVEIHGLRIGHFGDVGQIKFTGDQIKAMGHIDIAITQFLNPRSEMNLQNMKAYNLMKAISPSIIIPTAHGRFSSEVIKEAQNNWDVVFSEEQTLSFNKKSLPRKTTFLVWGDGASFIKDEFSLAEWSINNQ